MAEVARLDAVLSADAGPFIASMTAAGSAVKKLGAEASQLDNGLKSIGNEASLSTRHAIGFSQGLTELIASARNGSLAMGGFFEILRVGASEFRVIQQETGSSVEAFKGLFSTIFTEETVILLLVTAVAKLGEAFLEHNKKVKEAQEKEENFSRALDDANKKTAITTTSLTAFVSIARDNTKSLAERNLALEDANKLMGEHGEKLTLVNINTAAATVEIDKFSKALLAEAIAAKYADRVADLIVKQKDAIHDYAKAAAEGNKSFKDLKDNQKDLFSGIESFFTFKKIIGSVKDAAGTVDNYKDITKDLTVAQNDFNAANEEAVNLFSQLGKKLKDVKDVKEKPIKPENFISFDPNIQLTGTKAKVWIDAFGAKLSDEVNKSLDKKGAIAVKPKVILNPYIVNAEELGRKLQEILGKIAEDAATAIGEGIGNIISGKKNPFNSLFEILGAGIKALGKQLIEFSGIAKLVQVALAQAVINPYLALAAGVALEALGTVIVNKGVQLHAEGGIFTQPTQWGNHIIGEKGPEALVPLNRMNELGLAGGGRQVVVMDTRISGNDLILIQNRAQTAAGRAYGSNFNRRN